MEMYDKDVYFMGKEMLGQTIFDEKITVKEGLGKILKELCDYGIYLNIESDPESSDIIKTFSAGPAQSLRSNTLRNGYNLEDLYDKELYGAFVTVTLQIKGDGNDIISK